MDADTRMLIVRRLRQEADRLEAGGEPRECVARGSLDDDMYYDNGLSPVDARANALRSLKREREASAQAMWSDGVERISWGVVVTIEEARVTERECNYCGASEADEIWDYGLVDAGQPVVEPELASCDHPDCPICATATCRVCGCSAADCSGCIERTGGPCWWVEDDLCSACASKREELKP